MTSIDLHSSHGEARKVTRLDALEALNDTGNWIVATAKEWRRRIRERQQLAQLDDRMLSDIGISDGERIFLANKPFWRE